MKRYYMQIAVVIAIVMVACTVLPMVIDSMSAHTVARYYETTTVDTVRSNLLFRDDKAAAASKKLCGCLVLFTGCNFFRPKSVS